MALDRMKAQLCAPATTAGRAFRVAVPERGIKTFCNVAARIHGQFGG